MDFKYSTPSPERLARRHQQLFWNLPATARPRRKGSVARLLNPLKKSANPTPVIRLSQSVSLLRFTLLFVLATSWLLSLLPSKAEANYFLSAQVGEHSYGLPAYCESVTPTLTTCTPVGTLPLSSEVSSLVKVTVTAFQGSRERLECQVGLKGTFYCGNSLTQLAGVTKH
jgi:hypothetical protein